MKHHTHLALLATLVTGTAMAQSVAVSTTTIAQTWKQDIPGFTKGTFTPVTEFVGVDVTKIGGKDALSLHLYGWGRTDLADQSSSDGKHAGDLTYGYLQYNFSQANAELKAGRFTVNQGVGNEQVDGVSARTDLRYGFTVSGFARRSGGLQERRRQSPEGHSPPSRTSCSVAGRLAPEPARRNRPGPTCRTAATPRRPSPSAAAAGGLHPQAGRPGHDPDPLLLRRLQRAHGAGRRGQPEHQRPTPPAPRRIAEHDYSPGHACVRETFLTGTFVERNLLRLLRRIHPAEPVQPE